MESVKREHYGCNCYYCKLRQMIQEKLFERNDTYLIVPRTIDYKEKDLPYPFHNNWCIKYGCEIDEELIY